MKRKKALITGITGQDGSYLAELLLSKGYEVHGIKRRSSSFNTQRIDHLYNDPSIENKRLFLHFGDITDGASMSNIIRSIMPDEIYHLAAQSHVAVSFEQPEYTANADAIGTIRILEIVKELRHTKSIRFYQASTSELFGKVQETPQSETTPFYPRSPYAVAKLYAYWATINYREAYGLFAANGILFNHESPRRGETFVTRKITRTLCSIVKNGGGVLKLGNLNSKRDWGHAMDYVDAQWRILQHDSPKDFVIASGEQHSVREFCQIAAGFLGINLTWKGSGLNEVGLDQNGNVIVCVDPTYFRPTEVETLLGDPSRARRELDWTPKISFRDMVLEMVKSDFGTNLNEEP